MKSRKEFLVLLDELLDLPAGTLQGHETLEDLEDWDSAAAVEFLAMADEHYGLVLSPRDLVKCNSVNDLLGLLGDGMPA